MKQYKKVLVLLMALLCVFNLTGCGQIKKGLTSLGESIEKIYEDISEDYEEAKKAKTKKELTSDEYNDIVKDAYDNQGAFSKFTTWVGSEFYKGSKYDYYASKHEDLVDEKVAMVVNDKKLEAEKEKLEAKKEKQEAVLGSLKGGSGTAILIIIIIVIVVLLLVFLFMKMRQKSAPPVQTVVVPAQVPVEVKHHTADAKVNYERLLRDNCNKLGLDYEETLKQYGDARAAVDATNLQVFARK